MAKTIAVIGALDTKGQEFAFVKEEIENRGHHALVINVDITPNAKQRLLVPLFLLYQSLFA